MTRPLGVNPQFMRSPLLSAARLLALAGLPLSPAFAQAPESAPAPAATAPAAEPAPDASVYSPNAVLDERLFADDSTHAVLQLLRSIESPTAQQYRAAALALRIARRWRNTDAEVLRQEIEAWDAAQDTDRALAATRELIRLDPLDTVALLRVANARITNLQDADQRLAAYEGLISAKSIDPSVRSRLALDAALLARETGDERGFLDRLLLASTLDITNKEAAALTVTTYLDKSKDPKERFDLLTTLLLADPHDPEVHRNIAYELRRQMAFKASARFLDMARTLNANEGKPPTSAQQLEYYQSLWDSLGPEKSLEDLQRALDLDLIREKMRRDSLEKSGRSAGPEQDIRLPPALERVRLMIHVARMDDAGAFASVRSLEESQKDALQRLATDPPKAPEGEELPVHMRAESIRRTLMLDWVWVRLFSGQRLDDVEKDLEAVAAPVEEGALTLSPDALARYRGWYMVIKGDVAQGRAILEPLAPTDGTARWALGVAAQREGDTEKAAAQFEALAREQAASALGSAARQRWERIKGVPMPLTGAAKVLEEESARFAPWLEGVVKDPRKFVTLAVTGTTSRLRAFDRADLTITVGNNTRQPLGVGIGRSINPRMLLAAQMIIAGRDESTRIRPEVLNLARRLRLMPGESMTATLWGGRGDLTTIVDTLPTSQFNLRWHATQGFIFSEGGFRAGPNSVRAESNIIVGVPIGNTDDSNNPQHRRGDRRPAAGPQIRAEDLASTVMTAPEPLSLRALALACYRVGPSRRHNDADPVTESDARTLTAALTEKLAKASAVEAAVILRRLRASDALDDALRDACADAVKRINHPGLWLYTLTTLVKSDTDPLIAAAESALSADADFSAFIAILKSEFNQSRSSAPKDLEEGVKVVPIGPGGTDQGPTR